MILADPCCFTYTVTPPRSRPLCIPLASSLFLILPHQQQGRIFLPPPLVTHSPTAMYSKTLSSGLVVLMFALSAFSRLVLDLPPKTQMLEVPERIVHVAAQTPTTPDPPFSTIEQDPWQCITENITQYFDAPWPTGNLIDAIASYADVVDKPCRATATGADMLSCTVSDPKLWCGFTTFAAPDILTSYSTYVSAAASFVKANSATMSILSTSCPAAWARPNPAEREWLNIAIAHGQCYLQAHPLTGSAGVSPSPTAPSGRTTSTGFTNPPKTTLTTTTTTSKGKTSRGPALGVFAIMSTGLAVLAGAA